MAVIELEMGSLLLVVHGILDWFGIEVLASREKALINLRFVLDYKPLFKTGTKTPAQPAFI